MRVRTIVMVFLLVAMAVWGPAPGTASAGGRVGGGCLPQNQQGVTVLVRNAAGRPFAPLDMDEAAPFIDNDTGRTVVPLRSLLSAIAPGVDNVRWYDDLQTATFWHEGHTLSIRFPQGTDRAYTALLDKRPFTLTSYLCDGRVWVTARTVVEAFGVDIQYYADGIVLIDGVGKDPYATAKFGREATRCTGFPARTADYFTSPVASAQKAAMAVACQLLV